MYRFVQTAMTPPIGDSIPDYGILMSGLLVVFVSAISAKKSWGHEHLH